MGRLIDSDVITDFMLEHNTPDSLFASVEEIVAYQPTVFDVEAVVKEVQDIGTRFCTTIHCNNECENCDHGSIMKAVIDVIRKGGVNHD